MIKPKNKTGFFNKKLSNDKFDTFYIKAKNGERKKHDGGIVFAKYIFF